MMPIAAPPKTLPAWMPPFSPVISTSAQALPSGKVEVAVFFDHQSVAKGNHKQHPQQAAGQRQRKNAGIIERVTKKNQRRQREDGPAAIDSPAEPTVCTMLFSRMVEFPSHLKTVMEMTATGIEALTVSPARRAR